MNPTQYRVMDMALQKLARSLTPESGVSHPLDESKAIGLFDALIDHGCSLDYDLTYEILTKNGWPVEQAKEAALLAVRVEDGGVKNLHPLGWGERIVKKILTEITEA